MAARDDTEPAHRPPVHRRNVLLAGMSVGAAALGLGISSDVPALRQPQPINRSGCAQGPGVITSEQVYSRARGRRVDLVLTLPMSEPPHGMPVSLLLHGRGGSAYSAAPPSLCEQLGEYVKGGAPAFGFLALDGGNSYWHEHHPGDDPMAMLLEEVPGWLRARGLGAGRGHPFACTGTSMGGFGALLYARRRVEQRIPIEAIATISPALMTTWQQMRARQAFHNRADWASMDPLQHVDLTRSVPTAVWCGTGDPFIHGVRQFIQRSRPEFTYITAGGA